MQVIVTLYGISLKVQYNKIITLYNIRETIIKNVHVDVHDVNIVDPVAIAVVTWVLPVSAGVVVVVIGLVVRKKNKRMTSNVNNP